MASIAAVSLPEEIDSEIQSWDLAFKDKATSDYAVGQVWGSKGADRYLLDQSRARMDLPQTKEAIRGLSAKWPQAGAKLVEDKANGPAVIQELQHEIAGLIEVTPEGGKIARAHAVSAQAESGNIYLPHPAMTSWVDGFVEEATAFPNARHDDQVDAMTQALHRLRGMRCHFGVPESQIVVEPFRIRDSWPRMFVLTVTPAGVAVLWGASDDNGTVFLCAEHVLADAEPVENACAIKEQGDWIPGLVHTPSCKSSLAEKHCVTRLYTEQGLKVYTAPLGEEAGLYHLLQFLKAQNLKVFSSLSNFLSAYRTGDESALLLQCCYILLASVRRMKPKVVRQIATYTPSIPNSERGWMT